MHPTCTRISVALAGLAALVALAGCSGSDSDAGTASTSAELSDAKVSEPDGDAADGGAQREVAADAPAPADELMDQTQARTEEQAEKVEPTTPAVISTGTVSLQAEDVAQARFDVRRIVDTFRGTVTEQETTTGEKGEVTTARLVLRVPSARFADATAALEEVATLTASTSGGEDVSTEVIDVAARVRAQRRSVERIEALLARAENLQQVVSIENQLARRQADLDSLVARQAWLADQTSLSTITVYVEQPDAKDDEPDDDTADGFLGGLSDGWDSFVAGGVVVLTVLGFALPWLLVLSVLGLPLWVLLRRRTSRRTAPATP